MLLYYVLITLPCPTIARWTVGFKCCTYCEYKITIMLPSLVQLYTEPSNATASVLEILIKLPNVPAILLKY